MKGKLLDRCILVLLGLTLSLGALQTDGIAAPTEGSDALRSLSLPHTTYDAIIAGARANNWVPLMALSILIQRELTHPDGLGIDKLVLLKKSAIAACNAQDNVNDGVIGELVQCSFEPGRLLCDAGETKGCLSAAEVAAARRIYAGAVDKTGKAFSRPVCPYPQIAKYQGSGNAGDVSTF